LNQDLFGATPPGHLVGASTLSLGRTSKKIGLLENSHRIVDVWIDPLAKDQLRKQPDQLRQLADSNAPPEQFEAGVSKTVGAIDTAFGAGTRQSNDLTSAALNGTTPGTTR
jgi:hypothetical protein